MSSDSELPTRKEILSPYTEHLTEHHCRLSGVVNAESKSYPGANKERTWIDLGVIVGVPHGRWNSNPYLAWPFSAFVPKADPITRQDGAERGKTHPLFLALHWRQILDANPVLSAKDIAENEGLKRARIDQILRLTRLAPEVLEALKRMPGKRLKKDFSEPKLRRLIPLGREEQVTAFINMCQPK